MGAFKQAGIISVDSYQELIGVIKALAWQPPAKGNRVAMCTNGAGPIVVGIDYLERMKMKIPPLSPQIFKKIKPTRRRASKVNLNDSHRCRQR